MLATSSVTKYQQLALMSCEVDGYFQRYSRVISGSRCNHSNPILAKLVLDCQSEKMSYTVTRISRSDNLLAIWPFFEKKPSITKPLVPHMCNRNILEFILLQHPGELSKLSTKKMLWIISKLLVAYSRVIACIN